ncbi:hypothetical protein [Methanorbis furvi]|uniref:Uncharacterized protein n=1 Tax=Methanorbis furvi TaxID=3028299 RepID=A0AAE4MBD8_9EURY|nr:hypothetical protein [Methanocorpusculaceae archaeon Ag1]
MAGWRTVFLAVMIVCFICSAGCIGTNDVDNATQPPISGKPTEIPIADDSKSQVIQSFGAPQKDSWMVRLLADSYHDNPVMAELREFMNETWYPNGPVLGWKEMDQTIVLYVDAEHPPSYEEMSRIYQKWNEAANLNGSVPFMNRSLSITDIPLMFEGVTFPADDTDEQIKVEILSPQEGAVFWGDVVPHHILVDVRILSKYGLREAEVQSNFYKDYYKEPYTGDWSTGIVSTPLQNHITIVSVPTISGKTNISVVAVDTKGYVVKKMVNITVNTGIPYAPRW